MIEADSYEFQIQKIAYNSKSREDFWIEFINRFKISVIAEVGVFKGDFAENILKNCKSISKYYMVDPWKHLDGWNKPANQDNDTFSKFYKETIDKTEFAKEKREILRGKTTEVIDRIPDNSLDFAYIDGDHTLKGITIDLINVYPKIKEGGWLGGDDFSETIWQHSYEFEPTLIFPFAVYFAEAKNEEIFALPHRQFLIKKLSNNNFKFVNYTDKYKELSLKNQFLQIKRI